MSKSEGIKKIREMVMTHFPYPLFLFVISPVDRRIFLLQCFPHQAPPPDSLIFCANNECVRFLKHCMGPNQVVVKSSEVFARTPRAIKGAQRFRKTATN